MAAAKKTVTIHNDSFPKDQEFDIPGLGLVVNHKATTVDDGQIAQYEQLGYKWPDEGNLVIDQREPKPDKDVDPNEVLDSDPGLTDAEESGTNKKESK